MNENRLALYQLAYQVSQEKLASQAAAAIGADSRAMSFAGLCLTAAALMLGMGNGEVVQVPLTVGAFLLLIAGGIAAYSARPIVFNFPGANFEDLREDLDRNCDITDVLAQLGGFCETHIQENKEHLNRNAAHLTDATRIAGLGLAIPILYNFFTLL